MRFWRIGVVGVVLLGGCGGSDNAATPDETGGAGGMASGGGGSDAVGSSGGETSGGSGGGAGGENGGGGTGGTNASGGNTGTGATSAGTGGVVSTGGTGMGGFGGAGGFPSSCDNERQDSSEEGVDCGYLACGIPCSGVTSCEGPEDCSTGYCHRGICAAPVSGVHLDGLTLTAGPHPYVLTDTLQVAQKLTIDPGVVILQGGAFDRWDGYRIRANRIVIAVGTAEEPIVLAHVFMDVGATSSGSEADVEYAFLEVYGGDLWTSGFSGGHVNDFTLRDSRIVNSSYLYVSHPAGDTLIARNVFLDTGGVSVGFTAPATVTIENNYFDNVTMQGDASPDTAIELWNNDTGNPLEVHKNTFVNLPAYALSLEYDADGFDAINNYFGTTEPQDVANLVFDQNDNIDLKSVISVEPFLSSPDPQTPTP